MLWAAIRATQKKWPRAKCVVYSGDVDVNKQDILTRVKVGGVHCLLAPSLMQFRLGSTLTSILLPSLFSTSRNAIGSWLPPGHASLYWDNP